MSAVFCLECDRKLSLGAAQRLGDPVTCANCKSEFVLTETNPPEVDWLYDEDELDDFEHDDGEEQSMKQGNRPRRGLDYQSDDDDDEFDEEDENWLNQNWNWIRAGRFSNTKRSVYQNR